MMADQLEELTVSCMALDQVTSKRGTGRDLTECDKQERINGEGRVRYVSRGQKGRDKAYLKGTRTAE